MRWYTNTIEALLRFNDIHVKTKKFIAIMLTLSFSIGALSAVFLFFKFNILYSISALIGVPFLVQSIFLAFFYFKSKMRAEEAERYLPNLLELIATNIKSGMTPDKALFYSTKGESGPFKKDIKRVSKQTLTIKPLELALLDIAKRYNSKLIHNSLLLISKGVRGGGNLSSLLEKTAEDIRDVRSLKKEVLADVNLHALFLVFAAIVGAPLLFGTTSFLIDEITWISERTSGAFFSEQGGGFLYFSIIAVFLNSFFASLLLGTIKEGRKRDGLKYLPLFSLLAIGLLFFIRYLMQTIFFAISI